MRRARDVFGLAFFAVFWLLPITWHGFSGGRKMPFWPYPLLHLTNVSCLFTHAYRTWPVDFVQVQLEEGGEWETLPRLPYFAMQPFGYHTRMGEMLNRELGAPAVFELAHWYRRRYEALHPGQPPLHAVRFLSCPYEVGQVVRGRWEDPPLEWFPPEVRNIWFTRVFTPPASAPAARP